MSEKTLEHFLKQYEEAGKKGNIRKETPKGWMYISTPEKIEKWVNENVPVGKLATTKNIADYFTKKEKVDFTCPLTTGIFFSIAANVAEKKRLAGEKDVMPYWRIIKPDGRLYEKYLGQFNPQKELLAKEGFKFEKDNPKKMERVVDWGSRLV